MKPRIVVSGVNLIEAGPLAVFKDALQELANHFLDAYDVTALVHRKELFDLPGVQIVEFPDIKSSWLRRLHFEYRTCKAISSELRPHLWLAMHDITPNTTACIRAVYCHNPAPFYSLSRHEVLLDHTFTLFHYLYRWLYRINISQNDFVVVQQQWLREAFQRTYNVAGKVIVAHPSLPVLPSFLAHRSSGSPRTFLYPVYPRFFKNYELLLEATGLLEMSGVPPFEVWLTMSGLENRYAASLLKRFRHLSSIRWLGFQSRKHIESLYEIAGCLVFPSKLETWGMPLSEFKRTGKPILVADMPYARETIGTYGPVRFFPVDDAAGLAQDMRWHLDGECLQTSAFAAFIPEPFAPGWQQLFQLLLRRDA